MTAGFRRKPTITAAIIAMNEEAMLPGLLRSLTWVDEIVIVDGGSRDGTLQAAQCAGARVTVRPFDNFASQRNHALSLSRGDWVLSVDADERVTDRLAQEIRERAQRSRCSAFRLPIRSSIFGRRFRFSGTQDDRPIRLFRRGQAAWDGGVHEVLRVRGRVGRLANWLEHETLPDLAAFKRKVRRYTHLAAEEMLAAGRGPRWSDRWLAPPKEVFRRLIWKHGWLDGWEGWKFCVLSGWSAWVQAGTHRRLFEEQFGSTEHHTSVQPRDSEILAQIGAIAQ